VTLAHPELLPLLPLVLALVAGALVLQWRRNARLGRAFTPAALRRLFPVDTGRFPATRLACVVVAASAIVLAAVGVMPRSPEPPAAPAPLDLAIAVDVSASMGARDAEPSRVERARQVVARVAEALPGTRIVLVVFADWPYTLVPPTDDARVVTYFAEALQADLVLDRDQGTSLAAVLAHAHAALDSRPRAGARRAVLVVSDGGAHDDEAAVVEAAREVAAAGIEVWTAGLGSERGAPMETETGPVLDASGAPVSVRLEESLLRRVADMAHGRYERVGDDRGLRALVGGLQGSAAAQAPTRSEPLDATLLLTLLALPLMLLEGALDSGRGRRRPRSDGVDA
jgi:Ca-activated chloride channel family protein